jgi:LysR family transcriptional regulator of gallate degradation
MEKANAELMPAFHQGQFDFIIGILGEQEAESPFTAKVLFYDEMVAVVRPGHPLAKLSEVSVAQLAGFPWIYPRPGSAHRRRLDDLFKAADVAPPVCAVVGGSEALITGLLLQSDFVVAMSAGAQRLDQNTKGLVPLKLAVKIPPRPIGILHRGWRNLSPMAKALVAEIERVRLPQAG